ncbi:UDP-glycosyltransferase 88F5-like [Hordeum vulgare subsp. vulgare]|uniref:Glycosyltransferase n=1 Tax=Hordeum vulgare subsp. vulgare TaxID=112509 RepID=A0A8I6WFN6_HORVV|nr:UDP-glycosyltransferase 88F5-like [Hordeum vulgare subsp. vulgare]
MDGVATAAAGTAPENQKPRVVLYPSPGMGHLVSMIELGKLFAARGLAVTILIVELPFVDTAARGPFLAAVTAANPSVTFHCLPRVHFPPLASPHPEAVTYEVARLSNPHLRDFLLAPPAPAPAVLVVDFFCSVALDLAAELGVPGYCFFTSAAEALASFLYLPVLHAQTAASFREMGEQLVRVPGIAPFPATHAIKPLQDRDDAAYRGFLQVSPDLCRSQGIIVNTFRSLEPRAVEAIVAGLCTPPGLPTPPVHCIGPLIKSAEVGGECLGWLDAQPEGSVVFLCFGSLGVFSAAQIREIAVGLEASGNRFLWVVRSPPNEDPARRFEEPPEPDLDALLPPGFLARTQERGLVVKTWAPQRDVLAHGAVGGFVTHCGWNSVLEAVMAGVPMLAWPLYAEQRLNRVFLEKELGLAAAVDGYDHDKELVEAGEVEKKVRWLMESDGGSVLRERTLDAMRRAKEALAEGGESDVTLTKLVEGWTGPD